MNIQNQIIEYIQHNRISTTEVADALGKKGVMRNVVAITNDVFKVGAIRPVFISYGSNYALHEQIRDVQPNEIVIIFTYECDERAALGDLVAKYVLLYRGATAIVTDGLIRDVSRIKREHYPIWAKGCTALGCFNQPVDPFPKKLEQEIRNEYEGGVAICDDGGVTIIKSELVKQDTLDALKRIELQEDVWYYCLDTLKWDTKKIVCDKAYLNESDELPDTYKSKLADLSIPFDKIKK
tara:strand:+ start:1211 stop:1924 length:714 start_codon:yes stop_codon:yes gene_type:complete